MPLLTDKLIRELSAGRGDYFIWDTELSGFGVKVTPQGTRTFVFQWRSDERPRRTRRRKIARFGDLKTEGARKAAARLKRNMLNEQEVASKIDPVVTVGDAVAAMVREQKHSSAHAFMEREILPRWADKRLDDIRPKDIAKLLNDVYGNDVVIALPTVEALLGQRRSSIRVGTTDRTLDGPVNIRADKRAATASNILSAATETFLEQGFDASLDKIAERAKVTKPTIYQHFGDKKSLFRVAAYVIAEQCTPVFELKASADLFTTLLAFARVYRYLLLRSRNISFYRLAVSSVRDMPELWSNIGQMTTGTVIHTLSHYLDDAVSHRRVLPIDTNIAAENFLVAIGGFEQARLLLGQPGASERHNDLYVYEAVRIFVRGVGGNVPSSHNDEDADGPALR